MFHDRPNLTRSRNAAFLWQAFLVVPAIVVLSAIAAYALREDRASIEADARARARELAPQMARRFGDRLSAALDRSLGKDADAAPAGESTRPISALVIGGRPRVPRQYSPLPQLPAWPALLTPQQASDWQIVERATPATTDMAAVRQAASKLAAAPREVRANAEWVLLSLETNRRPQQDLTARLLQAASGQADVLTPSGVAIADLAVLLALRDVRPGTFHGALVDALERRVVEHPSFLTPDLLEHARRSSADSALERQVSTVAKQWEADERARALLLRLGPPSVDGQVHTVWLQHGGVAWVALSDGVKAQGEANTNAADAASHADVSVTFMPVAFMEAAVREATALPAGDVPPYFSGTVRLGDRTMAPTARAAAGEVLASASARLAVSGFIARRHVALVRDELPRLARARNGERPEGGDVRLDLRDSFPFAFNIVLGDADALYARYRQRWWLALGLIFAASMAALGGLASTWRAFVRERRLGEMKSNFVASVSHELRAPIASVRLMAETLDRGAVEGDDKRREYLRLIVQECRRLSALVANVLDFSRIDQGRTRYTFEATDLCAVASHALELLEPYAAERGVRLERAWAADREVRVRADAQALEQALINLVDNAIKHSPGGAAVTIGIERADGAARLFVQDQGPGIPAEEHERIFEPFYRRGSEIRRETQGIGIGLTIVRHVAEAHGGRAALQSEVGGGSRFTIELPASSEPTS